MIKYPMLRTINLNDMPQVLAIERIAQVVPWSEEIFQQCLLLGYPAWVIEQDKKILAFIMVVVSHDECHILNVSVHPHYQRQGWGSKLIHSVLTEMKSKQVKFAYLEVRRSNASAIALYKKLGFQQVGIRKDYYPVLDGREDALVFAKEIA